MLRTVLLFAIGVLAGLQSLAQGTSEAANALPNESTFDILRVLDPTVANAFFTQHQYCYVEIRAADKQEASQKPFSDKALLAVGADSEHLQVQLLESLKDYQVSHRLRKASGPSIEFSTEGSDVRIRLTQKKPFLGCVAAPSRHCRMSFGRLDVIDPSKPPAEQAKSIDIHIKDWCGGAKKESLFWAPLNLEGVIASQWDTPG